MQVPEPFQLSEMVDQFTQLFCEAKKKSQPFSSKAFPKCSPNCTQVKLDAINSVDSGIADTLTVREERNIDAVNEKVDVSNLNVVTTTPKSEETSWSLVFENPVSESTRENSPNFDLLPLRSERKRLEAGGSQTGMKKLCSS